MACQGCSIRIYQDITFQASKPQIYYKNLLSKPMRLLVNYKGINKIMLSAQSYEDIVKFIKNNFFLNFSKWTLHYIDSDGDQIALDSEIDFQTMLETTQREHVKLYLKDKQETQHVQGTQVVEVESEPKIVDKVQQVKVEPIKQIEVQVPVEKIEVSSTQPEEVKIQEKKQIMEEVSSGEMKNEGWGWGKCHGRGMWKKRMEEKMAKFVDERIQTLMPCIIKQVEQKIKNVEVKPVKVEGTKHEVKCNGCGSEPIFGIRYKCVKCPLFNLCQTCEAKINHEHNMIKMKNVEEQVKEETKPQFFGRPPMPFGHFPFGNPPFKMPPPPPMPFGHPNGEPPKFNFGFVPPPPQSFNPFMAPPTEQCNPWMKHCGDKKRRSCDKSNDPRFKITKKCFKMSRFFGGSPKDYEEFVNKNKDMRIDELCQLYTAENKNVKMSEQSMEKTEQKLQKLSFYFNKPAEDFKEIVNKNPATNFRQLLKLINKEPVVEKKEESKVEEPKAVEVKKEEKEEIKAPSVMTESVPSLIVPLKKPVDIKKRNEFVLEMKDLLGPERVFDYINFYNDNNELEKEAIIELFLQKQHGN